MCQEAKKEMSFEVLENIIDDSIRKKDTSAIEAIENKKQLKYMQKYTELLISHRNSVFSSKSFLLGKVGMDLATFSIGLSLLIVGILGIQKTVFIIWGIIFIVMALFESLRTNRGNKELIKGDTEIKFMHAIILKIEAKL